MSAANASPFPIKNKAFRITFPILDAGGDLVANGAGLDSEISKDGGTFADCTNEATEISTSSGMYFLDLTASEMNADTVALIIKSSSTGAKSTVLVIYPIEIVEPSSVPTFGSSGSGVEEVLAWLLANFRNKKIQTNDTTTLRNDADNATIATSSVSGDETTTTFGEWSEP
jgi:hypothetical protein